MTSEILHVGNYLNAVHLILISCSVIKIAADEDRPSYDVVALLDPATRAAQKYTPLLLVSGLNKRTI